MPPPLCGQVTRLDLNTGLMLEYHPTESFTCYLNAGYKRLLHGHAPALRASFAGDGTSGFAVFSIGYSR